jgi:hypothetical protein
MAAGVQLVALAWCSSPVKVATVSCSPKPATLRCPPLLPWAPGAAGKATRSSCVKVPQLCPVNPAKQAQSKRVCTEDSWHSPWPEQLCAHVMALLGGASVVREALEVKMEVVVGVAGAEEGMDAVPVAVAALAGEAPKVTASA